MIGDYFSHNGALKQISEAAISLGDINYAYGYGVYETLKLRKGHIFFTQQHVQRLLHSAEIIDIAHDFAAHSIAQWLSQLVQRNNIEDANIKMMLIGSSTDDSAGANLYIMLLNPLFPPRKLYRHGAHTISYHGERIYPQAKSLNMLGSVMAYRQARQAGAYDALMVNRQGYVTEGTRTNIFATDGHTVYTPPAAETLAGVTKSSVISVIHELNITLREDHLPLATIQNWKGLFLTSTSSKVMPIATVDTRAFEIPPLIRDIIRGYDDYLNRYLSQLMH